MSLEGQNKFRLSQLEIAVRMQTEAAVMRWSKMQRQAMRNLAVEEGQGGQTTLSFGRKEVQ